ncbi:MAG: redoxin domain-containing protein, partial [Xanthomarina sp.]
MAQSGYKVGDIATDFKLENIDGKMVSLSDYKEAKGFIVIFTCNTCPFSVAYEDRINALNKKYESQGYPVIAIMPNNPVVSPGDNMES